MGKFKDGLHKLAFLPNGEFSITRLVMVGISVSGILLIWIGLVAHLVWGKTLPDNLYLYVGGLMGGGIVQYGMTKFAQTKVNGATNGKRGR